MNERYLQRFGGVGRLYGRAALERFARSRVLVIGIGGVGSWASEALARSGVGTVVLADLDDVCVTNTNRQAHALEGHYGRPKVDAMAERLLAIHPEMRVERVAAYVTAANAREMVAGGYDALVDAVDRRSHKCAILAAALDAGVSAVTVGGAGGRKDAGAVRTGDLAQSEGDELLRQVRKKLRREYGLAQGGKEPFGIRCVYSAEKQVYPRADGTVCAEPEEGVRIALDCQSGFGTSVAVTGTFGFAAAGEVLGLLAGRGGPENARGVEGV